MSVFINRWRPVTDDLAATRRRLFGLVCRVSLSRAFFCQLMVATPGLSINNDGLPDAGLPKFGLDIYGASSSQDFHMTAN